jgi:hypothetical protein
LGSLAGTGAHSASGAPRPSTRCGQDCATPDGRAMTRARPSSTMQCAKCMPGRVGSCLEHHSLVAWLTSTGLPMQRGR